MNFRREAGLALREDRAWEDVTARLFLPKRARGRARLVVQEPGVIAGLETAAEVFRRRDHRLKVRFLAEDGAAVRRGQAVLAVQGPLASLLSAERSALNLLSHLSGIATLTRRFVRKAGPGPQILETRKTLPGLRDLQKYAVRVGGGANHRRDLSDAVLIKENHLAFYRGRARAFIRRAGRARRAGRVVEMECRNRREAALGLAAGADILLLDNIAPGALGRLVRWIRARDKRVLLEVSGGVTLANVRRIARAGVDRISIGRLTHSAPALDINMDVAAR